MPAAGCMPVLFIGHGSPMNAIEHNAWSDAWRLVGAALPRPRAILCVSAHWQTDGTRVTGSRQPVTLHDFQGFPPELSQLRYLAPGDPALAARVTELVGEHAVIDQERGLDHGAWGVLLPMFPAADVPVLQLSLDPSRDGVWHYRIAQRLNRLRDDGVLLLCTGNIVHNLTRFDPQTNTTAAWALRFRDHVLTLVRSGDHAALMQFRSLPDADLAAPTPEHFLPLLYALANGRQGDKVTVFNDDVIANVAMTSLLIDIV